MITKWDLAPSPDEKNKNKHRLLLKCDLKDIFKIVKKLGPVCSRPERIISKDFNFLLYIYDFNTDIHQKIKEIVENGAEKNSAEIQQPKPSESAANTEVKQSKIESDDIDIPMPDLKVKKEVKKSEQETADKSEELKDTSVMGPLTPSKTESTRIKREEIEKKKEEEKKEEKVEEKDEIQPKVYDDLKIKWSIELPLNPTMSFQTLITGSHNRFAHAAAMAVVENPGVMYNPILIYGPIGVGKSHFIHSMSYGLSASMGQKNIFVTDGIKFSVGVNMALKEGFINNLKNIIEQCKVLIIDDIHLMLVNKNNKNFISEVLLNAMNSNKQIVFSSLFSPTLLEPLENMLGIQLSQGWMVDIKLPNQQTYRLILDQILNGMDIRIPEDAITKFFISKMMDFATINKLLFKVKKLEKFIPAEEQGLLHQDLIAMLAGENDDFSEISEAEVSDSKYEVQLNSKSFYKIGVFYPKGFKKYINYVFYNIKQTAREKLNLDLNFNVRFMEEYDPDEVYGIPFKIGEYILDKDINRMILLSPPPTSALSSKKEEFKHLTEKIVESFNIRFMWIPVDTLKAQSVYLNSVLDLI